MAQISNTASEVSPVLHGFFFSVYSVDHIQGKHKYVQRKGTPRLWVWVFISELTENVLL